jgi:hypothetical protein
VAAHARAQVLAEFVLLHGPVIRLVRVPDHISRFEERVIEPDDLVSAFPDVGPTILRVRDRLSHSEEVAAVTADAGRRRPSCRGRRRRPLGSAAFG